VSRSVAWTRQSYRHARAALAARLVVVTRLAAAGALGCLLSMGCKDDAQSSAVTTSGPLGAAVAQVNGDAIALGEVQRLCDATGLAPREALERLIAERLLVQHAAAQGYGELAVVERGVQQARVQALLAREIEGSGSLKDSEARRDKLTRWLALLARGTPITYDEMAIRHAFAEQTP